MATGAPPRAHDIVSVNRAAELPPLVPKLSANGKSVQWSGNGLESVLSQVARDLIALYDSPLRERVRICGNPDCGVPFVDLSRAGARRWCSMSTCGATEKKRAYRVRLRLKSGATES